MNGNDLIHPKETVPAAYGKDTSTAAGMALVSHLLSILTIPLIFILLKTIL